MKKNEIVILCLKLLGIYITVQALSALGGLSWMNGWDWMNNFSLSVGYVIYLLAGLILVFMGRDISRCILPPDDDTVGEFEISETFQKAALRIMGVYVAILAIPSLVNVIGQAVQYDSFGSEVPDYLRGRQNIFISPLVSSLVRFLLGVFLMLGPSSVVKLLSKFDKTIAKIKR